MGPILSFNPWTGFFPTTRIKDALSAFAEFIQKVV